MRTWNEAMLSRSRPGICVKCEQRTETSDWGQGRSICPKCEEEYQRMCRGTVEIFKEMAATGTGYYAPRHPNNDGRDSK